LKVENLLTCGAAATFNFQFSIFNFQATFNFKLSTNKKMVIDFSKIELSLLPQFKGGE
jgi:hypothetical protein